jgi:TolB-like protein
VSFFDELKRRNVFRVGVAYLVMAWLALQVVDTVAPLLNLPDTFGRGVLLLLAIGFPFALVFSWAYELTEKGLKKTSEVDADESITHSTGQRLNRLTIVVLVVALGYFIWESRFQGDIDAVGPDVVAEAVVDKTIAVLPFASFSEDAEQAWFADGLTEEILNALARTPDLLVSSRTSSFSYKDTEKDLQTIASELGVAHILEGSVRRGGDRLRITAQLIRSADGFHLWSETYDADASDVIRIQEDVASNIARAMQTAMDPAALAAMVNAGTSSVEAYEAYLEGNAITIGGTSIYFPEAAELWEEAIRLDPEFVSPYVNLAEYWHGQNRITSLGGNQRETPQERTELGNYYAEQAIELLGGDARADYLRGLMAVSSLNYATAIRYFEAAAEKDPNNRDILEQLSQIYTDVGDFVNSERVTDEYVERFPRDREFYSFRISDYVWVLNREKAARLATDGLADHPTDEGIPYQAHRAYLLNGQIDEARALLPRIRGATALDETAKAVVEIRQACAEGDTERANELADQALVGSIATLPQRWLALQTTGRFDEAVELLAGLDNADGAVALASFLTYYHFDISRFPYLQSALERNGFTRQPWQPVPFGCEQP